MSDVNRESRPLSPHLQIYRPQWTSVSSIMVRITGIATLASMAVLVLWLVSVANLPWLADCIGGLVHSPVGVAAAASALWAGFYLMLGRLRHVIWDLGYCLDVPVSERLAKLMFVLATLLTALVFLAIY